MSLILGIGSLDRPGLPTRYIDLVAVVGPNWLSPLSGTNV